MSIDTTQEMFQELSRQVQECMMYYNNALSQRDSRIEQLEEEVKVLKLEITQIKTQLNTTAVPQTPLPPSSRVPNFVNLTENSERESQALATIMQGWCADEELRKELPYSYSQILSQLRKTEKHLQFTPQSITLLGSTVIKDDLFTKNTVGKQSFSPVLNWTDTNYIGVEREDSIVHLKMCNKYYFEVQLRHINNPNPILFNTPIVKDLIVSIGVCDHRLVQNSHSICTNHVGWQPGCIGMHSDDGNLFNMAGAGNMLTGPFGENDVMGCGFLINKKMVFFTRNGSFLCAVPYNRKTIIPTFCMEGSGEVQVNWGQKKFRFQFNNLPDYLKN
nr:hypothetical protein [Entamoeba invadens]BAN41634.1 hypothetical protein [Entamoeba invadens]BAN42445.1 hypothetical protein [Entamoeba invadens]